MINKKNLLGKRPFDLGVKDAIHTAIVSVRAGGPIEPGTRCGLNEFNEAIPDAKGCGVADPFLDEITATGQNFWLLLDQDEVPNVTHHWEHPTVKFDPPTREVNRNKYLLRFADDYGVTYEQLMDACASVVKHDKPVKYPGTKTPDEVLDFEYGDLWCEWRYESGYEFENAGTECCPEYRYPDCSVFE